MPGGYQSEKGPDQGFAVLTRNAAFIAFVIKNTLAMCMYSGSVLLHIILQFLTKYEEMPGRIVWGLSSMLSALVFMVVAFITDTYAILGHSSALATAACLLGCFYFFAGYMPISLLSEDEHRIMKKNLKRGILVSRFLWILQAMFHPQKSEKHSRESG
ncbi:ankyrin repeat-containing protein [Prunus yedoensis var. nudiflora]|uniref:Ankyrin repeat-containing protein n=1 Tax=Prunus yedoensis var. nudiflora TaxID=2094558 RepID=A0A314UUY1_PRUYE|nr:ankyrin repeat-containing protein [Prunus yedoensis var. nudiflora]